MELEHGVPLRSYRPLHFLLALPFGLLLRIYISFCRITSRITVIGDAARIEKSSIIFLIHRDYYTSLIITPDVIRWLGPGFFWLGYHGFFSYVPYFWFWTGDVRVFRYSFHSSVKPFRQLLEFLKKSPGAGYAQYTDSGGPYGRVRESIAALAKELDRSVFAARIVCRRRIIFLSHQLPLPFSRVEIRISEPVSRDFVRDHTVEAIRNECQTRLDAVSATD